MYILNRYIFKIYRPSDVNNAQIDLQFGFKFFNIPNFQFQFQCSRIILKNKNSIYSLLGICSDLGLNSLESSLNSYFLLLHTIYQTISITKIK